MSAGNKMAARSVDYDLLEKERAQQIERNIQTRLATQSLGRLDSLRHAVLACVVRGDYMQASDELDHYVYAKAAFPSFPNRTNALVQHAKELINAIRRKRNFPGMTALTMSKQQEILDHVLAHFEELKQVLKHIERVAKDCALEDLRSTVWLLKTSAYVVIAIAATAFLLDFSDTLGKPLLIVYEDFSNTLWKLISSALKL